MNALRTLAIASLVLVMNACGDADSPSGDDRATNDRGVALMGRYEYEEARDLFADVVERAPGWLDAQVNLAIATLNRQQEGDEQRALNILDAVLREDPDQLRALYMTGIIRLYLGEPELATASLRKVLADDPDDAYAAYFLGQSLLQAGDSDAAAEWLVRATQLDPYLRSAYWAAAQVLRGQDRAAEANALLAAFQKFEPNPAARVAAFSYRRMGPKADALATVDPSFELPPVPSGPLFAERQVIDSGDWAGATVTSTDINGDGAPDLFLTATDRTAVFLGNNDGSFSPDAGHALSGTVPANAALWGDLDDDGLIDVVLCGDDGIHYWQQLADGAWRSAELAAEPCQVGALFDADHDGDLDIFVSGPGGNELLSNNRNGSFRRLAESMGLRGSPGRQLVVTDLDADRDLDILVVSRSGPNDVWQNDRTWQYQPFAGLDDLRNTPLIAATVADTDADGHVEIYGATGNGAIVSWRSDGTSWTRSTLVTQDAGSTSAAIGHAELSIVDFDGDGVAEILFKQSMAGDARLSLLDPATGDEIRVADVEGLASAIAVPLQADAGPALIGVGANGIDLWPPGKGRYPFMTLLPTGRSEAEQMRSNASGIGTRLRVRTAGRWTVLEALDPHSGPGQSLLPLSVGLRGRPQADFVELEWSDGVSQTEVALDAGKLHAIAETQRQLASCPVLFAWNGDEYRFVSDVLGVGGLGFFIEPGVHAPPRPFESYLLDAESLKERDGRYAIKLSEPMEENAYLDAAYIHVFDLPEGWSMVLDERAGISGPEVTSRPITYRRYADPVRATDAKGGDVTSAVLAADHRAPDVGEVDHRFIGLLAEDQVLTIEFDEELSGEGLALVADGWIEYPYSQTVFAAWQAGVRYRAPTLEARGDDNQWVSVAVEFGYPAGMPRKMLLPLSNLPAGTRALRLSSNMEVYWDRLQVVWEEPLAAAFRQTLEPAVARVAKSGFAKRTTGPQRLPHYDYKERSTYWDAKFQRGFYTAFGDATELVSEVDSAVAIIGGGEEIHLEFPVAREPAPGTQRYFVLEFRGWAKDMDLYTQHGETVGPLPELDGMDEEALQRRRALHAKYNLRFQQGL